MMVNMLLRRRRNEATTTQDEITTTPKPREPTDRSNEVSVAVELEAEKVESAREDFANGRWRHTSWAADNSADWETEGTLAFEAREGAKACGLCLRSTCVVS